ncbi:MAG: hypothetical protein NT093_02325 [Candidatus Moranbacteria bacterium]|nr:hypothetical protein [Candidatus Moranbacteria bacterium]
MDILILLFFFGVSSNIVLLLLLKFGFRKNIGDFLTFALSYGIGPFFFSLIFYASIYFFPAKENIFYSSILGAFCLLALILCRNEISELKNIHFNIASKFIHTVKKQSSIVMLIAFFFIGIYSIQLLAFPIINNDSVLYLNQSEAFFEYKNINWQKKNNVIINGDDLYAYNSSIRPGIPLFNAATYLFQEKVGHKFLAFKFLIFYYYTLLLVLFLWSIGETAKKMSFDISYSFTYGLLLFVFSWGLSRMLIFSAKEVIIYFFALFSIYIASLLIDEKTDGKSRFRLLTIFAILLGINSFINLHGIVIEVIVIFILFILSKNKFFDRIKETGYILLLSLPFSGFEFLTYFNYIFLIPIQILLDKFTLNTSNTINALNTTANTANIGDASSQTANVNTVMHQNLYQFKNIKDEYLKGKFQILTNIGSFGAYFWMYIIVMVGYFKSIFRDRLLKFL